MKAILTLEVFKYVIVGVMAVLTDFIFYRLLLESVGHSYAKAVSYVMGMVVAFLFNRYWTFQSKNKAHSDGVKFVTLYAITLCANVFLNKVTLIFLPGFITFAFLVATGTTIVLNYIGQKFFVFTTK